ncbi:NtaA/DmoA family FMN-dependent monooxygenase [Arthrobacter ginkgonis]|uniref:NtaA/DmoA family FMN-dependent monooxygenase n=1 Tax=Arthrobacter ginkgonis TaxID=1630594 RepID=A0ABP7C1N9_9MICC
MATPLHFGFFSSFSAPAWHAPDDRMFGDDWPSGGYHSWLARRVEAAKFDFLFFEDTSGVSRINNESIDTDLRYALSAPKNDPVALITYLSAVTERLGLVATASTSLYPPFLLARLYSTIDSLSRGRAGWNIVTSSENESAQNFGQDALLPTQQRYDKAEEFVEVVSKLWGSWDADAVVKDLANNVYTDSSRVRSIDHAGEHFKVRGPLNTYPSPQHRPVFAQAGGSPRGRDFAAKHAELIMSVTIGGVEAMKEFREDIHARMRAHGRDPREARIVYALHPHITENVSTFRRSITDEQLVPVLGKHGAHLGVDLLTYDLDRPFPTDVEASGTTSMLTSLKEKGRRGITLREAIIDFHWGDDELGSIGPASSIAENLISAMDEAGGDGYIFMATQDANRAVIDGIIDELVPELQRRGAMRTDYAGSTFRENLFAF